MIDEADGGEEGDGGMVVRPLIARIGSRRAPAAGAPARSRARQRPRVDRHVRATRRPCAGQCTMPPAAQV
jgi:hypothetical protein